MLKYRTQICHERVQLLIMLEVQLQIHAAAVFVLHTHFQISSTASKLSCIAQTTTVLPTFSLTVLPFDKVALAFMWLAPSFSRISHYTPYITF
jgi:hypothetical protein